MAFTYSAQLYPVRTLLEQDPLSVLHQIKRMGYIGVEGFGEFKYSAQDVNYALSETGLKLVGYHTPWAYVQDDKIESTIQYFKAIGNKYVIIPAFPGELTKTIDDWKRLAEKSNTISQRLQNEGMIFGYHNHAIEFQMIDGQLPFTVYFDSTDPAVVVQIDNGNAMNGGGDVMGVMRKYPGRARSVHIKPFSKTTGLLTMIGEDDIDWAEFMHWCRDKGNTEHYIVEYGREQLYPLMKGIELCIKGLKELEASGKI